MLLLLLLLHSQETKLLANYSPKARTLFNGGFRKPRCWGAGQRSPVLVRTRGDAAVTPLRNAAPPGGQGAGAALGCPARAASFGSATHSPTRMNDSLLTNK